MLGVFEEAFGVAVFDDLAAEHDGDALAEAPDDGEVVGDEDERHPELAAEPPEFREDLGLDGDVERGGGLVGDEEFWPATERHRDHRALLHPAAELVRVIVHALLRAGDADGTEPFDDFGICVGHIRAVEADPFGDLAADGIHRVERSGGFLKNIGDPAAADQADLPGRHLQDVPAEEKDFAARVFGGRARDQAGEREGGDAFPAAALADDRQRVAFLHRKRNIFDGLDGAVFGAEPDGEVVDFEKVHGNQKRLTQRRRGAEMATKEGRIFE